MKCKHHIFTILLAATVLIGLLPINTYKVKAEGTLTATVSSTSGAPSDTVTVDLSLENNSGLSGMQLDVSYDENILTLTNVEFNGDFGWSQTTAPTPYKNPQTISMASPTNTNYGTGVFATLTFMISEDAGDNVVTNIELSCTDEGNVVDGDIKPVDIQFESGSVTVYHGLPGDINGDSKTNMSDAIVLFRYVASWSGLTIDEGALDCNGDGKCNMSDAILLFRYVAGWNVKIGRGYVHKHNLVEIAEVAATCETAGNIAYWYCDSCGKYFKDAKASKEITQEDTVVEAKGHTVVVDEAVAATYETTGLTEGAHCSVCNKVLVEQTVLPILKKNEYAIQYNIAGNDSYLKGIEITNPNPSYYVSEDGMTLSDLTVDGYVFEGWYDGQSSSANKITSILKGETGTKVLYAHWSKTEYTITFNSPISPVESITYTPDVGATLTNPEWYGYTFVGWTDEEGNLVTEISPGTAKNITLTANWTAKRNQTRPVESLSNPLIVNAADEGYLLFSYEIGTIENVPLYEIEFIGNKTGLSFTKTYSYTKSISSSNAKSIAESVANVTTNTSTWTLSKDWNSTTSINKSETTDVQQELVTSYSQNYSDTGTYNIGNTFGGSKAYMTETGISATLGTKVSTSASAEGSASIPLKGVTIGGKVSSQISAEVNASTTADAKFSAEKSFTWNTNEGYSSSHSASKSSSVSNNISKGISEYYGYGSSYAEGGSENQSQQFASSQTTARESGSTLTYTSAETVNTVETVSDANAPEGYYRIVQAGTVHVFAVVTYDISNGAYGVYTYGVMDDKTYQFVDYSKTTPNFNDNENGVLPFSVPYEVEEYVYSYVGATEGLQVDIDTGIVEQYVGDSQYILIPKYVSVSNGDGSNSVVKVTGISSTAFAGKDVKVVYLNDGVTSIPDGAFAGCTSLEEVWAPAVTSIGNNAFDGCTSLTSYTVPSNVTYVGSNAFNGVQSVTAKPATAAIADAIINSGAKNISVDMAYVSDEFNNRIISIPDTTESFEFVGASKTYSGVKIVSDAAKTILTNATFADVKGNALKLSSPYVALNRVNVSASGWAMILTADSAELGLFGTNTLTSSSENAIISKSVDITQSNSSAIGKISSTGNVLVYGDINNTQFLSFNSGELKYLTDDEYNQYKARWETGSFTISYDANGGSVDVLSQDALCYEVIGEMPTPTREYYSFTGWYTEAEGGEQVTADTVFDEASDITLYAHWTDNELSDWVLTSDAPENAVVVNHKWSYTLRSYMESGNDDESGWTKYDTQRTSWGAEQGPVYSDPSDGLRNVRSEQYVSSSNYKTVYVYYRYTATSADSGNSWSSGSYKHEYRVDSPLEYYNNQNNLSWYKYWHSSSNFYAVLYQGEEQEWVSDNYSTRWYYQDPVYTYYYYKDDNLEADSCPSGDNISNVVEWVQYRSK